MLDAPLPTVVDGDGLFAMAWNAEGAGGAAAPTRDAPTVLTPHDGEYALLTGAAAAGRPVRCRPAGWPPTPAAWCC